MFWMKEDKPRRISKSGWVVDNQPEKEFRIMIVKMIQDLRKELYRSRRLKKINQDRRTKEQTIMQPAVKKSNQEMDR